MVWVVVTTDAEAKQLAGSVLNLETLDLQGGLEEPVAGLEVPVAAPQEVHAANGEEVSRGQPLQERLKFIWITEEVRFSVSVLSSICKILLFVKIGASKMYI